MIDPDSGNLVFALSAAVDLIVVLAALALTARGGRAVLAVPPSPWRSRSRPWCSYAPASRFRSGAKFATAG